MNIQINFTEENVLTVEQLQQIKFVSSVTFTVVLANDFVSNFKRILAYI
jgi:hypothetical protein